MPQPATHYLVTRRAIPQMYWKTWWDEYKSYFGLGSSAPDLFYFPLIPGVKNIRKDLAWEDIANPMHSSKSYDMFCSLLDFAKTNKKSNQTASQKQFAFAVGYYCHVVADCIFHPYVYRSTGDYWCSADFSNEIKHKLQELFIDTGIYHKYYGVQNFSRIEWRCNNSDNDLLDYELALVLHQAMLINYADCYPDGDDITRITHPIQQAYLALQQSIPVLFSGKEINLFGKRSVFNTKEINVAGQIRFFSEPFPHCGALNRIAPETLFDLSSFACQKIFLTALSYWESSDLFAKDYFKEHPTHYLGVGNWNLDTGLPSQYNNYSIMRETNEKQYMFCVDELIQTLVVLEAEYNLTRSQN